jgi:hypothetical protein
MWEPGSEFRQLSPMAQWSYTMLLSQPQISNLGLLPYVPEKWVRLAAGLTTEQLEEALHELEDRHYVIIDKDAVELLVRTFIKHDQVFTQPALTTNARVLIRSVESETIRTYLLNRHVWLDGEAWFSDAPAFIGKDNKERKKAEWTWDKSKIAAYESDWRAGREPGETPLVGVFSQVVDPLGEPGERAQGMETGDGVGEGSGRKALENISIKGFTEASSEEKHSRFRILKLRDVS